MKASTLQSIRLITLPLLQPTILAAMTLRAIDALKRTTLSTP